MLISWYADHVVRTNQFKRRPEEEKRRISVYGLVSEIGSVASVVKKQMLGQTSHWPAYHELKEELGDAIWYCFALAEIENIGEDDILALGLKSLSEQIKKDDEQSVLSRFLLDPNHIEEFHRCAEAFPSKKQGTIEHFQKILQNTTRAKSAVITEASLIELMDISTQLMRLCLSESEWSMHDKKHKRPALYILEEIVWHLTVIASVYELPLVDIVNNNIQKALLYSSSPRLTSHITPLHDKNHREKLPRQFKVQFLTVGEGLSRMYWKGLQLGDELTDNYREEDGYRFHDALHLANIVHLGWSPVFRGLMKRKRKSEPKIDEAEDGARAIIVEEMILKAIHSEGTERAEIIYPNLEAKDRPIFTDEFDVPFSFFKLIRRYVKGLEVEKNSFHEWEMAIREGYQIYNKLREYGQGTVTGDLHRRIINFSPKVYVDISGTVASVGSCAISLSEFGEDAQNEALSLLTAVELCRLGKNAKVYNLARHFAAKRAILRALGIHHPELKHFDALNLSPLSPSDLENDSDVEHLGAVDSDEVDTGKFSVEADPLLQKIMWKKGIIVFKTSFFEIQNSVCCTALALSDVSKKKG